MNQPKLKYPRLCRILSYVIVIGGGLLPIGVVFALPVPDLIRVIVMLASLLGLLAFLWKYFLILMMMDMALAMLSCYRTARERYDLPNRRTGDTIRRSIDRWGQVCEPAPIQPQPVAVRYRFCPSMTIYASGIERVLLAYETDVLDAESYRGIFSSAKTNSRNLMGKRKPRFLDKQQKTAPLNRATVLVVLARRVDAGLRENLYELVCKQCGDESTDCIVPCVVDLERNTCAFNCVRVPYVGLSYAVKNRGIRLVRRVVFGGDLNLRGNDRYVVPKENLNPEKTLWDLWRELKHQFIGAERAVRRRFESMASRELIVTEGELFLKWDQRGIHLMVELNPQDRSAKVEQMTHWAYPKSQPIGKKTIQKLKEQITEHFRKQGYRVAFAQLQDFSEDA